MNKIKMHPFVQPFQDFDKNLQVCFSFTNQYCYQPMEEWLENTCILSCITTYLILIYGNMKAAVGTSGFGRALTSDKYAERERVG